MCLQYSVYQLYTSLDRTASVVLGNNTSDRNLSTRESADNNFNSSIWKLWFFAAISPLRITADKGDMTIGSI